MDEDTQEGTGTEVALPVDRPVDAISAPPVGQQKVSPSGHSAGCGEKERGALERLTSVPRSSSTMKGTKGKMMFIWKPAVMLISTTAMSGFFGSGVVPGGGRMKSKRPIRGSGVAAGTGGWGGG